MNFIDSLHQGQFTALYDGRLFGIGMLANPNLDIEGKAIVTFTDGTDNYSIVPSDSVTAQLKRYNIKSYTIGLRGKGNLDETMLRDLSVSGAYEFANSPKGLQNIFNKFSNSVSDVYNITYTRNRQAITTDRKIRFEISTKKKE